MYRICSSIYVILYIQYLCKSEHSIHLMYKFSFEFMQFYTIIFFANPNILYKNNVHNFLLNLRSFGRSIFLQIQTFRTCNVQNFPLSLRSSRQSIFLQIQTFCTNIMYTIFCRIYAVLDVQFICKAKHSVHVLYTISN